MDTVHELREGKGDALTLIRALFIHEIQKQLDMDRYKTATVTPSVLDGTLLMSDSLVAPPTTLSTFRTTDEWSAAECVAELVDCISSKETKLPMFDKDDDLAMRFVTAAANLRMIVFGITPLQSLYSAKGIAGNIIPAIATTNAIVAGLQILQTFHILKAQMQGKGEQLRDCCNYINCIRLPVRNGLYLTSGKLDRPNPACFVCSKANVPLNLKISEWTLRNLLDKVIKKDLGFEAPSILIESNTIWEEGDGADTEAFVANLDKKLADLPCGGIQNGWYYMIEIVESSDFYVVSGTIVVIEDFTQDLTVDVGKRHESWSCLLLTAIEVILDVEKWDTDEDDADVQKFVLRGTRPTAKLVDPSENEDSSKQSSRDAGVDEVVLVSDSAQAAKRKRGRSEGTPSAAKKMKPNVDDIVVID
jgi:ubiquitin-like 1-activating enzyme E1 B